MYIWEEKKRIESFMGEAGVDMIRSTVQNRRSDLFCRQSAAPFSHKNALSLLVGALPRRWSTRSTAVDVWEKRWKSGEEGI